MITYVQLELQACEHCGRGAEICASVRLSQSMLKLAQRFGWDPVTSKGQKAEALERVVAALLSVLQTHRREACRVSSADVFRDLRLDVLEVLLGVCQRHPQAVVRVRS